MKPQGKAGQLPIVVKVLLVSFSFLLFTQTALHLWPPFSFSLGVPIDYLAPTLYLTDILFFLLLLTILVTPSQRFGFWSQGFGVLMAVFTGMALINLSVSVSWGVTLVKWVKLFEVLLLVRVFSRLERSAFFNYVARPLMVSVVLIVAIALVQIVNQASTGLFTFLGERRFSVNTPGIAKRVMAGVNTLRAYSTFSHPNSFAGFLLVVGAIGNYFYKQGKIKQKSWFLFFALTLIGIVLSLSWSVFAYLVGLYWYYKMGKTNRTTVAVFIGLVILVSLVLPFLAKAAQGANLVFPNNVSQRVEQYASLRFTNTKSAIFGYGLNTFTQYQEDTYFHPFSFQPVHNGFLVVLFETGLVGLGLFSYFLFWLGKKINSQKDLLPVFAVLLLLLLLDHYQLTLQQNLLVSTIGISLLASNG